MLTVLEIKKIKSLEKTKRYWDDKGMSLEVTAKGGMFWKLKYQFEGKDEILAIGTYPDISLAQARKKRNGKIINC